MNRVEVQDIVQVTRGVIGYQANCVRQMRRGLGFVLRRRFPSCHDDYAAAEKLELGDVIFSQVGPELWVAHLLGQQHCNPLAHAETDGRREPLTDYAALGCALERAQEFARAHRLPLWLPVGLGCGEAGGSWRVVSDLIARQAPDAVICQRPAANF